MITAKKLSAAVAERLEELRETPEALVGYARSFAASASPADRGEMDRAIRDAELVRPAVDERLSNLDYGTVRAVERALGFSEFTLFALSADGRGLPEFGEEYIP